MNNRTFVFLLFSILLTQSCSLFKKKQQADPDLIARIGSEELYASDLQNLTKGQHGNDSLNVLKSYAENWVRRKLLLQKASENIDEEDAGIARLVEDYREKLLLYEYEKAIINQKLDTAVSADEVKAWYDKTKTNFPLAEDVFQIYFFKLKPDAPDLASLRKLLASKDDDAQARLEGYCRDFAISYSIDRGMWYVKENALRSFPITDLELLSLKVGSGNFREFNTTDGSWFIRLGATAKKDEPAPLDFIAPQIVKAIVEKRRVMLIDQLYERIYKEGIKNKSFEILIGKP